MNNYILTRFLYSSDEVLLSLVTTLLKRDDITEAYYWAYELYYSGEDMFPLLWKIYFDLHTLDFGGNGNMDAEAAALIKEGLQLIGAGLAMTGAIGAGAGVGLVVGGAVQGIARNPDAGGTIQANMILGIAFAEAIAIYALVVALIILFVA